MGDSLVIRIQYEMCFPFETSLHSGYHSTERYVVKDIHKCIVYYHKTMKTTRMPATRELVEQIMANSYSRTFSVLEMVIKLKMPE